MGSFACRTVGKVSVLSAHSPPSATVCSPPSDSRSISSRTHSQPPFASTWSCQNFPTQNIRPQGYNCNSTLLMPKMPFRHRRIVSPCPSVLKPHLHLSWSQVQLLSQGQLLLLQVSTPPFSAKIPKYPSEEKFLFFPPFSQKPNTESL